tara:strand:+ start:761 stop:1036 length:276 start_codon:yes stop_codon:yes gene_type:complete
MKKIAKSKLHYVYIVQCADGTFYTGYTTNVKRRLNEHNYSIKRAAKYTRSRRPVVLKYFETYSNISDALKRERKIKKLSRKEKKALIDKFV